MEAETVSRRGLRVVFPQAAVPLSPLHATAFLRLQVVEVKRMTVLPWGIWALVIFLAVFIPLRCAQGQVSADTFTAYGDNGDYVRITDKPCPGTHEWLDLREAEMRFRGKDYKACWFRLAQFVIVLDESKDKSPIPINAFKKDMRT